MKRNAVQGPKAMQSQPAMNQADVHSIVPLRPMKLTNCPALETKCGRSHIKVEALRLGKSDVTLHCHCGRLSNTRKSVNIVKNVKVKQSHLFVGHARKQGETPITEK